MLALREFRSTAKGLPDLLNYAAVVDDGVVLNKDGSLTAAWSYRGEDLDSASVPELSALSARVNAAFARRGSGWMVHVDALRTEARGYPDVGAFPDRTTLLIDARAANRLRGRGRALREPLRARPSRTFRRSTPSTRSRASSSRATGHASTAQRPRGRSKPSLGALVEIEDNLSAALRLVRLRGRRIEDPFGRGHIQDELLRHLMACLTGEDHPVNLPPVPMYLDAVFGAQDFFGGLRPRIGCRHIRPIAITGFPAESYPGILDFLNRLPLCYRWSTRFILLDTPAAQQRINRYRARWWQKRKSLRNLLREQTGSAATHVDADADAMATDAVSALAEASSGAVKFGYYTSVVVLMDENAELVDAAARDVLKAIHHAGFGARIEDVNAVEAFLGTLPGPRLSQHPQAAAAHAQPRRSAAAHDHLAGTRAATVSVLSAAQPAARLRGDHRRNAVSIEPARRRRRPHADRRTDRQRQIDAARVLARAAVPLSRRARLRVRQGLLALRALRRERRIVLRDRRRHRAGVHAACADRCAVRTAVGAGVAGDARYAARRHRHARAPARACIVRSSFSPARQAARSPISSTRCKINSCATRSRRTRWPGRLGGCSMPNATNSTTTSSKSSSSTTSRRWARRTSCRCLLYLFHRVQRRLARGRPAFVALGEAWLALSHPLFREKIREWLKTLRKNNGAAILETQSISDITGSPIRDVIIESCLTKIFLPNSEAQTEHAAGAYKALGTVVAADRADRARRS